MKIRITILIVVLAVAGAFFVLRPRYPEITISNHSSLPVTNVVLSGSGFSEYISAIPANTSITRKVIPNGESSLEIEFEVNSKKMKKADLAYLEATGGYRAHVEIDRKFKISCDSSPGKSN